MPDRKQLLHWRLNTLLLCIALVFIISRAANAQDQADLSIPIRIAGTSLPYGFHDEKPGPYNTVYDLLVEGYTPAPKLQIMPIRRATVSFYERKTDCYYIGNSTPDRWEEKGLPASDVIQSEPILQIFLHAYTRKGEQLISSTKPLDGKNIAIHVAAGELEDIPEMLEGHEASLYPVQTVTQAFAMLMQGRVDVAFVFGIDADLWLLKHPGRNLMTVDKNFSLYSQGDNIMCIKKPGTEAFIAHVNKKIAVLGKAGILDQIFRNPEN